MIKLRNRIPTGSFARSVAVITGGTALGQGLAALASPLLTRLYTPQDLGVFAAFTSIFGILLTVNSLRYELAIPIADTPERAAILTRLVMVLVLITTILFGIVFMVWREPIAQLVNAPALAPYFGVLLISLLGAGFYQALTYWAIRQEGFKPIARTRLSQSINVIITQLALGFLGLGALGLIVGHAVGQFTGTTTLFRLTWRGHAPGKVKLQEMGEAARRYRRFPLYTSWAGLLNTASVQLTPLFVISLYGADVAGWFSLGVRVVGLPMILVGQAVSQVYFSKISQLAREKPNELPAFFSRTAIWLFGVGVLPIGALALLAPPAFGWLFGPDWIPAGEYIRIIAPMYLVQFVVSSLSTIMFVLERQDIQSLWDTARLILLIVVYFAAQRLQVQPAVYLGLYTATMSIMYLLLFVIQKRAVHHYVLTSETPAL